MKAHIEVVAVSNVVTLTRRELEARREAILRRLGTTLSDLEGRAAAGSLVGDEWDAWDDLRDIAYLLGDQR